MDIKKFIKENKDKKIPALILLVCLIIAIVSIVNLSGNSSNEKYDIEWNYLVENFNEERVITGEICELAEQEERCYLDLAILSLNDKHCEELSSKDERINCEALASEDIEVCGEIESENLRNNCYDNYAKIIEERNSVLNG